MSYEKLNEIMKYRAIFEIFKARAKINMYTASKENFPITGS